MTISEAKQKLLSGESLTPEVVAEIETLLSAAIAENDKPVPAPRVEPDYESSDDEYYQSS